MIVVVAGNHDEYEQWLRERYTYVGDKDALAKIDPATVEKVEFVGNYRNHPFYWTNDLIRFQMDVALNERDLVVTKVNSVPPNDKSRGKRLFRRK